MKILLANNELRGGGAEKVILTLINEFLVMKHEVHLIIFDNIIEVDIPNNLILHIIDNKNKFIKIYKLKSLMKKLEHETRFDLVLSNLPETDYFMRKLNHQNIYFCIHTTLSKAYIENKGFIKRFKRKIKFNLLYKNQNIITVSNGVKDDFLKNMKIPFLPSSFADCKSSLRLSEEKSKKSPLLCANTTFANKSIENMSLTIVVSLLCII